MVETGCTLNLDLFKFSLNHLLQVAHDNGVSNEDVFQMFKPNPSKHYTLRDINKGLITSLANRNMMSTVIAFYSNKGRNDQNRKQRDQAYKDLLLEFDPQAILSKYTKESLYEALTNESVFQVHKTKNRLWRVFANGVISGSVFLSEFNSKDEFFDFVSQFASKKLIRLALPLYIAKEVDGYGFALACDFLKELGFIQYPKPDVHIGDYFKAIGSNHSNDFELCKRLIDFTSTIEKDQGEILKMVNDKYNYAGFDLNCYAVDKMIWLLGSWYFYDVRKAALKNQRKLKADFLAELSNESMQLMN